MRIRELILLIISYLFRQTHNTFIKENKFYGATDTVEGIPYYSGAIVGVLLTGLASDLWLPDKRFLLIFVLNSFLLIWDIYMFIQGDKPQKQGGIITFSMFLGAFLESANLIYLILMPMLLAKNHSEKMSQLAQY